MSTSEKTVLSQKAYLKTTLSSSLLMGLVFAMPTSAYALPQNGSVAGGAATITSGADTMDITQDTDRTIINWDSYDIAAGETVNYVQPSAVAVALNRVTGSANASQIFGTINANGQVVIVNRHGVVFGSGSQVNVAGLVATSSDTLDADFMAGGDLTFNISGDPTAQIVNNGNITVSEGGLAALVGPSVTNNGYISARLGKIHLASGDIFTIDLYGDGLILLQASAAVTQQLVSNTGTAQADGGQILMTAAAAEQTVDSLINMSGVLQADTVDTHEGRIVLSAGSQATVTPASATAQGKGTINVTGTIFAKGDNDLGSVDIKADTVSVNDAYIDVNDDLTVFATTSLAFENESDIDVGDTFSATMTGMNLDITGDTTIDADKIYLTSANNLHIEDYSTQVHSETSTEINTSSFAIENSKLTSYGSIDINADSIASYWGRISTANPATGLSGDIELTAASGNIFLQGGSLYGSGAVSLEATNGIAVVSNSITAGDTLSISATKNTMGEAAVYFTGTTIRAGDDVTIDGTAGGFAASAIGGVYMADSAIIVTGDASVTVTGQGGVPTGTPGYPSGVKSYGVRLNNATIYAPNGDITIAGTAGNYDAGGAALSSGVVIQNDSDIYSGGDNTILISGQLTTDPSTWASGNAYGIYFDGYTSRIGYAENIIFKADTMAIDGTSSFLASARDTVSFVGYSDSTSIGVAGGTGTLSVSASILDNVTAPTIQIGSTTQSGDITAEAYTWWSSASFITGSGNIVINGPQTLSNGSFLASSATGNITLTSSGGISSGASDDAIILVVSNGTFINNAGSSALSAASGRWLVYGTNLSSIDLGGDSPDFRRYSCTYGGACPSVPATGNGVLYSFTPYLQVYADSTNTGSVTYGANDGSYTYSVDNYLFASDASSDSISGTPVYATSYVVGDDAGSAQTFTVSGVGTLTSSLGYGFVAVTKATSGTLTVNPATLIVTGDDLYKTYGQDDPAYTYSYTGLYSGDNIGDILTGSLTRDTSMANQHVGTYAITQGTLDLVSGTTNYTLQYVDGSLRIRAKGLLVRADYLGKTYGDSDASLTYDVTGLQYSDTASDVFSGTLIRETGEDVGIYSIERGTLTPSSDYYIQSYRGAVYTISPAVLYVSADDKSMIQGETVPALTYSYGNLASWDSITSVLSGDLYTAATSNSAVGTYAISQGSLALVSSNYTLDFTPGELEVQAGGINKILQESMVGTARNLGYNGVLLAMSNMPRGALGQLSPAAGGQLMSAAELANLAPAAGGQGPAGTVVSLIECSDDAPCQLNQ